MKNIHNHNFLIRIELKIIKSSFGILGLREAMHRK